MNDFCIPAIRSVLLLTWCVTYGAPAPAGTTILEDGSIQQPTLRRRARSYAGMNRAELKFCANPANMANCLAVKNHSTEALQAAERRYPQESLHNGDGDAFRHCYWCARMSIDLGEKEAKGFGDRHERVGLPSKEMLMDLRNNAIGRLVGKSVKTYEAAAEECSRRVSTGDLSVFNGVWIVPSGSNIKPTHRVENGPKIFRHIPRPLPQTPSFPPAARQFPFVPPNLHYRTDAFPRFPTFEKRSFNPSSLFIG